jgi:putative DNA primase/helicase
MFETAFQAAMAVAGFVSRDLVIADARIHRFHVEGDRPGTKNGWYVLFSEGIPSGAFGSWKTGMRHSWCMKAQYDLTPTERIEHKRRMETARKAREVEDQARKRAAQEKALHIWQSSHPVPEGHSYLVKKGVKNHGLRLSKDALVIPLRDSAGVLHSLQFIDREGNKRFLSGGRKRGCYFSIGQPKEKICIAEGYATAASIHETTDHAVAVAFDAGNLKPVAEAIRKKLPDVVIIMCADNDINRPGNPGLTCACDAAAAVDGFIAVAEA